MRLWIGIASVVGAAALLVTAAASAGPPDHFTESGSYGPFSASCGSFTNYYQGSFALSGKTMYDKAGNPVKDVVHESSTELNWRSGNSDSYTVYSSLTTVYDYATDTTTVNGMPIKVTYPGLGILFHDVGTVTFDGQGNPLTIHGPHDTVVQGQDAYCNAFLAIASGK